jgi:nucleoside-triphosphatase THEP1
MQLLSVKTKRWIDALFQETQRPKPIIGTIVLESDDPFVVELKRFDGVKLFPMTVENRDTIHQRVIDAIKRDRYI